MSGRARAGAQRGAIGRQWRRPSGRARCSRGRTRRGRRGRGRARRRPRAHGRGTSSSSRPLAEVDRHRDDLGAVALREPGDGDGALEAVRRPGPIRLHRFGHSDGVVLQAFGQGGGAAARRGAITRIVSSPAIVPTTSGEAGAVERLGERLRLAPAGADDDELLHAIDAAQELGGGALERGERGLRVRRLGAGPLVGAVARRASPGRAP